MKPDRPSTTAAIVALHRAAAHGATKIRGFDDPIAAGLLTPSMRLLLPYAHFRSRQFTHSRRPSQRAARALLGPSAEAVPLRTVAIDACLRENPPGQFVILGAGLDARAWRLPELKNTTVFEVDHPATQRYKRERVKELTPLVRDHRFVAVNFERDSLDERLGAAGHDRTQPTFWLWEGVMPYLWPAAIRATLGVVKARSVPGSRLAATYAVPVLGRTPPAIFGLFGEPFVTAWTPEQMRDELQALGWHVTEDSGVLEWVDRFGGVQPNRISRLWVWPERLVVAAV
jgi:methyltransferase (TIGR00027 family)